MSKTSCKDFIKWRMYSMFQCKNVLFFQLTTTVYKLVLFVFAGPNVPRSTLHKTSSSETDLVIFFLFDFLLIFLFVSSCFSLFVCNVVGFFFLLATWYKELQMNSGLREKMSELRTPKRRNFMIPAGKYGKSPLHPTPYHPPPQLIQRADLVNRLTF